MGEDLEYRFRSVCISVPQYRRHVAIVHVKYNQVCGVDKQTLGFNKTKHTHKEWTTCC